MMRKRMKTALTACLLMGMYAYSSVSVTAETFQGNITLEALIENAEEYDGMTVSFEAEAIGDPLKRSDYTWVNASDGNNSAIGVYMTSSQASEISVYGAYEKTGDILLITGTFHEACAEHGGDLDIHALSVEIKETGSKKTEPWSMKDLFAAVLSAAAAGSLLAFALYKIRCYNSEKSGKDA